MTCEKYRLLLRRHLDANAKHRPLFAALTHHEAECAVCAGYRVEMQRLLQDLHTLDEHVEVPESFSLSWRQAVRTQARFWHRKPAKSWSVYASVAAILVLLFGGTALFRTGWFGNSAGIDPIQTFFARNLIGQGGVLDPEPGIGSILINMPSGSTVDPPERSDSGLLILRTGDFVINTVNFENDLDFILSETAQMGGLIEKENIVGKTIEAGRRAELTLRIPDRAFDGFTHTIGRIGTLVSSEISAEDYADRYTDYAARLAQYELKRDRIEALLQQAETIEEIIKVESSLAEAQYQIESIRGTLQNWEDRSQFGQVRIYLSEANTFPVGEKLDFLPEVQTQFERSWKAIADYFRDMLLFLVIAAPWIVLVAALTGLALFLEHLHWRRSGEY